LSVRDHRIDKPKFARGSRSVLSCLGLLPRLAIGSLLIGAVVVLLLGVVLRYVVTDIAALLNLPSIGFFWVEEVGELALAWLVFIAAAVGIREKSHFAIDFLTGRLPKRAQYAFARLNALLIAGFSLFVAYECWKLVLVNKDLTTPALSISLGWLYFAGAVGCCLIFPYAVAEILSRRPSLHSPENIVE